MLIPFSCELQRFSVAAAHSMRRSARLAACSKFEAATVKIFEMSAEFVLNASPRRRERCNCCHNEEGKEKQKKERGDAHARMHSARSNTESEQRREERDKGVRAVGRNRKAHSNAEGEGTCKKKGGKTQTGQYRTKRNTKKKMKTAAKEEEKNKATRVLQCARCDVRRDVR
jgi:hypothetical protein